MLKDIELSLQRGEIVCLYGPSGCGKSTLLRCIAGLDDEFEGQVALDGNVIRGPSKLIGMTVQSDVSYGWLTVEQNIAFGLRYMHSGERRGLFSALHGRVEPTVARQEARRLAEIVGLAEGDLRHYPHELSGGMKQRMAFARALLPGPRVLLLDEPFSALEYESRNALQDVVLRVREELGTSFILVSHDPEEVVYLGDRIFVLTRRPATIGEHWDVRWNGAGRSRFVPAFLEKTNRLRESLRHVNTSVRIKSPSRALDL